MRKRLFTSIISILMIFVIAGCSNSGNSNQTPAKGNGRGGFQKPDVYGEVSAINGNTVTLKLLEIPQMKRPKRQVRGSGTGNMGVRNRTQGNQNSPQGNGGQGSGRMGARTYTGEEKTMTIPDGVSLTTMTRGTNGMEQSNITLDQITTGSTLSIYYDTDGKTIKSIRVQKPWTGNGQAAGNTSS